MGAVITEPVLEQVFGLILEKVIEEATCKQPQERPRGGVVCSCLELYFEQHHDGGHGPKCAAYGHSEFDWIPASETM